MADDDYGKEFKIGPPKGGPWVTKEWHEERGSVGLYEMVKRKREEESENASLPRS